MAPCLVARLAPAMLVVLVLGTVACTSQREHRAAVRSLDETWQSQLGEDDYPNLLEHIRSLGEGDPRSAASLVSVAALSKLVVSPGGASLSALGGRVEDWKYPDYLRAEALRHAWRVGRGLPQEPYIESESSQTEFNSRSFRFEELVVEEDPTSDPEFLELVGYLGSSRLAIGKPGLRADLASNLAELVASQAAWGPDPGTRDAFAVYAPGSVVHALSGVTLLASRDADAFVREEAARAAAYMHPETARSLLEDALGLDPVSEVRRAALGSVEILAQAHPQESWSELLDLIGPNDDEPLRLRAAQIRESWS